MKSNKLAVQLVALVAMVIIVGFSYYLGHIVRSMDSIEEKLSHQAQQTQRDISQPQAGLTNGKLQRSYVPVYSHIYVKGGQAVLLESTLTVRNTDPQLGINIHSVEYFDTKGHSVQQYVEQPYQLNAMASSEYLSEKTDISGGAGANFLITWSKPEGASAPIFEAVMVGSGLGKNISFTSRGEHLPQ
ncbi:DUF3124 domain-containing protein [Motilimonas pumila]|uniref:DUF3124 domain-containing protein n=1 Tax=Motilimonas pumila TaxID=2303987 RepID=A0A418YCU5_9GAMM|nr:DUF3124 domain-containing protein [Motilimonas pumila]RJG42347.1 DUF3124 domain-containing protein [Motilimonas pumila]